MAINIVREFLIELKVQLARMSRRNLDSLEKGFQEVRNDAEALGSTLRSLTIVTTAVGAALGFTAKAAADFGELVQRSSVGLGISIEEYQRLHGTFQLLDADIGDLQDALGTVTDRVTDALEGNKTYRKELERLGVQVKDLEGQNPAELFFSLARAGQQVADKNEVVTASVRLFGDDLGRKLLPALVGGGERLDDLADKLERTGLFFDQHAVDRTKMAAKEYRFLWFTLKGLTKQLGAKLAPIMEYFARVLNDFLLDRVETIIEAFDQFSDDLFRFFRAIQLYLGNLHSAIMRMGGYPVLIARVTLAFKGLSAILIGGPLIRILSKLPAIFASAKAGAAALSGALTGAGAAAGTAGAAAAAPLAVPLAIVTAIVVAVVAAIAAIEDMYIAIQGGESAIKEISEGSSVFADGLAGGIEVFSILMKAIEDSLKSLSKEILALIGPTATWSDALEGTGNLLLLIAQIIGNTLLFLIVGVIDTFRLLVYVMRIVVATIESLVAIFRYLRDAIHRPREAMDLLVARLEVAWGSFTRTREAMVAFGEAAMGVVETVVELAEGLAMLGAEYLGFDSVVANDPSLAINASNASIIGPVAPAFSTGRNEGSMGVSSSSVMNVNIDARGADAAAVEAIPGQLQRETDLQMALVASTGGER